jgi:hypothetical protein
MPAFRILRDEQLHRILLPIAYVECDNLHFARVLQFLIAARVTASPLYVGEVLPESPEPVQSRVLQRYYVLFLMIRRPKRKLPNQAVTCLTEAIL